MKYKKFCSILGQTVETIDAALALDGISFERIGPAFSIKTTKKKLASIQSKIDDIIKGTFGKDASKYRKYNYCDKRLFLQFKRRIA